MWWGLVCVLVSHFPQDTASVDGESKYPRNGNPFINYRQIFDFIESHYGEVSAPEANFLNLKKNQNDRVRQKDDKIKPLTPMPKEAISKDWKQREIGATPLENGYTMYDDHNVDALVATTTNYVGGSLRKPRDKHGLYKIGPVNAENIMKKYIMIPTRKTTDIAGHAGNITRQLNYFDIENPSKNDDKKPTQKYTELNLRTFFHGVTEQATMGARPIATIEETTLANTVDSQYSFVAENDISSEANDDVTDSTRKTIDYHTTVTEDTAYRPTKTIDHHTTVNNDTTSTTTRVVIESTTNENTQTPQSTVMEINWAVEPLATILDSKMLTNSDSGLTSTEAVLKPTQITPTRSATVKTTAHLKESTALDTTTIRTEESSQNFGTDETTQSTFVEPTDVTANLTSKTDSGSDRVSQLRVMDLAKQLVSTIDLNNPKLDVGDQGIVPITKPKLDIPILLEILDSVVNDSDKFSLLQKFNESLQNFEMPECPFVMPSTTEGPSTMNFNDAKVVAKCFVCGLDVEGVPYTSACADAFAGDFIPLVPLDPKARGQIANYRKYCRYLDTNRVIIKEDEPHSVFGRFTGGCSVRWVDITSIYTQRACRNRRRAVLGKHFGSKRMAKLEMALNDIDNGCIISPVATLLPLSRGISLYARFHACVCTGSWCNRAVVSTQWMGNNVLAFVLVTEVSRFVYDR